MKRFGDYSLAVRNDAIDMLAAQGIYVWDADFDPNSEKVLFACNCADCGFMLPEPKDKALYTWTPEMVEAYQNRPDATPGMRLSEHPDYSQQPWVTVSP